MAELTKGGNAPLAGNKVLVTVSWLDADPTAEELDVSCFLLTDSKKVRSDADMIFYGQRQTGDGAVSIKELAVIDGDGRKTAFEIDLGKMRGDVTSLAVVATTGASAGARKISALTRLGIAAGGEGDPITYLVDTSDAGEAALILGEVYLRNGAWKFRAVGQGFNGGLSPLAQHYGVDIAEPAAAPPPTPTPPPTPAPPPPSGGPVNLSKVTLTKDKPSIDLKKKAEGFGEIRINLNWNVGKKGMFGIGGKKIDLDLGCLFELADGRASAVQALGNTFGSYHQLPFIELSGDDRSGASTDGEWMRINGSQWNQIKRVLIYAFIYEGVPNWASADGVITLYMPNDAPIEVRLDERGNLGMCAVAEITNVDGGIRMSRVVEYFRGHEDMSNRFRFPLQWRAGRK